MSHFPDNIMTALKDAVINVFWKKKDVRSLFDRCGVASALVASQDWTAYKINIVAPVIDALNQGTDGLGPLRQIIHETLQYTDGKQLMWLPDADKRCREAERSLEHLRLLVKDHDAAQRTKQEERQARHQEQVQAKGGADFRRKLGEIKDRFLAYHANQNRQQRGYALEEILYDAFLLFDLQPRGPFKRTGEQIDGAFVLDRDHFLLEAKWQAKPVILNDLRDLDGAVGSSLDNTLGLFVSLNGFSEEALTGYLQGNRPRIVCMDGQDLMAVLDQTIELPDLILRKKDLAVQKRSIFIGVREILKGAC
jgi:hypothetical protein